MNFHSPVSGLVPTQSRAGSETQGVNHIPPCRRGGAWTLPSAAATSCPPRHRLFHPALPGSCSSRLCPRLRVEQPRRGGPAEEPGAERRAGPLSCAPRGQPGGERCPNHGPHPRTVSPHHPCLSFQLELRDVADRVNLGLIPSSEEGWPVACRVLKKATGGVLHIHHNVESVPAGSSPDAEAQHPAESGGKEKQRARIRPEWKRWAEATASRIRGLLAELHGQSWSTSILHIEAVKSYAPHVHHLVLDLECRPTLPTEPTASSPITSDPTGR